MKVLITGGRGMLGKTLQKILSVKHEVIPVDLAEADITSYPQIAGVIAGAAPDAVIHCAAMTKVDDCESKRETAFRINAYGTGNVAAAAAAVHARLIAISTDYVFDGDNETPRLESDHAAGGRTVYGQSKFAGEMLAASLCPGALICRIAWLYGPGGPSFVHSMLKLADGTRPELKVVNDQFGNPTSTIAVSEKLLELLEHPELSGVCHLTCEGICSWYDFACEIFRVFGIDQRVLPCTTAEFPRPAPRPHYSALKKGFLAAHGLKPMPSWQEALRKFQETGL